jgi:Kelch motif
MPWTYEKPLPTPRNALAAATGNAPAPQSGSRIYAIGGSDAATNNVFATVEAYDTSTQSWSPIAKMNTAREAHAAAWGPDGLHALGGTDGSGTILATHEIYNPATNAWSPAPSMPTARSPGPPSTAELAGSREPDRPSPRRNS